MRSLPCRLAALGLLVFGWQAAASVPSDLLSGYTTQQWQSSDGLPEQTVQAFAQNADGYLWIGTSGGLLRFDGAHFTEYGRENTPAFLENSVFCLTAGKDGTLWIGTEGGGLIRFRDGVFRLYSTNDGLSDGFVRSVIEDRRGAIWIGTDNGLFQLANSRADRVTRIDSTADFAPIAVHALLQDRSGRIWVGGSRLISLDTESSAGPREYKLQSRYSENRVKSILQAIDGTVWVGTVSGLQQLRPGSPAFSNLPGIHGTVRVLRQTLDGTLWIGTIGQGAFTYRSGVLTRVVPYQPLPSSTVLSILEDTTKNVWLGTEAGMVRLSRTPVSLIPLPDASDFETISADNDGSLWVASTKLFHLQHGVATPFTFPQLRGARVRNVFRDRNGSLWIGTDGSGLFHLTENATEQYTTTNGLTNNFVRAITQARNGDIWIATDEGLNRLAHGTLRNFRVSDGLSYFSVRTIVEGSDGDIWIGTDRGLSHLHQGTFQHDTATEALQKEKVWSIHVSRDGDVWFGTRNSGLYRFAKGKMYHFTQDEGLAANSIYSILEDSHRRLWIGSPDGVSLVDRREFDGDRDYTKQHLSQRFYGRSDAGDIAPLYGGTQPAAAITENGDVWFPTNKGPIRIVDTGSSAPTSTRLMIDQVIVDGRKKLPQSLLPLPSSNANLEISYAPILLSSQADLRFMYKLDGFDRDWVYASSRRIAYYTNLPAGTYTFRVRALSPSNSATISEATLALVKRPFFYRTPWFFGLCLLTAALAVWGAHLARVRRMHTAFRAVLEERARLAREMHDTLIQGCASVSVLLEACSSGETSDSAEQYELIDYARTQLAASIDEARQAVWNLRAERSDDLGTEIRKLADRISRESNIAVACHIEGTPFPLRASALHELLMISREALYNAALHATPTELILKVVYGPQEIALEVHDNGCGFDQNQVNGGHYGLIGIEERVRQLGGTLQVRTMVAKGTDICAVIPRSTTDAPEMATL
jgi:ligand-binding sensor domain-containing protein/signal transduction histidine kinase